VGDEEQEEVIAAVAFVLILSISEVEEIDLASSISI
jgi:hypothetical protein